MSSSLRARRIRSGSISLGLWASALTFLLIEVYAIPDQWRIGRVSVVLMLALLTAGVSIGLFAVIAVIGMIASAFFSERPSKRSQGSPGSSGPIHYRSSQRSGAKGQPQRSTEAQGTPPKARVLVCRIDIGARSLPIYLDQPQLCNLPIGAFPIEEVRMGSGAALGLKPWSG
jgi:hypothetical protein